MSTVQLAGWSFGTNESALSTMRKMAQRVRETLRTSRYAIDVSNNVVSHTVPRDRVSQIRAISDYVSRRFRFVPDPIGVELLRDPTEMIFAMQQRGYTQGDCDDAAMVIATLGMANGIPARFRALAFYSPDAPYTHVIADLCAVSGRWFPLDVTKPQRFDAPEPTRTLTIGV